MRESWKSQLAKAQEQLTERMTLEEKKDWNLQEQELKKRQLENGKKEEEFEEIKKDLYDFLTGYKQNSGIFINNFFRRKDYETYCADKFETFDFDVNGIIPNLFDDPEMSFSMVHYLAALEKRKIAYFPISVDYIRKLIAVSKSFDLLDTTKEDTIVYRGCSTLKRNGVNGIVSTTSDKEVAEQFSRGTILTILLPKGSKKIDIKSIRPLKQQKTDLEKEWLLPPCQYEILEDKISPRGNEPNNHSMRTRHITLRVKQLDLLEEFWKVLQNPPVEYLPVKQKTKKEYDKAVMYLEEYLEQRETKKNHGYQKVRK